MFESIPADQEAAKPNETFYNSDHTTASINQGLSF